MRTLTPTLAVLAGLVLALSVGLNGQLREAPIPHTSGQSVSPVFEGWYPNADGSFSMSFGYFNRNYEEVVDIPMGPNNRIEPGPADQGQPTRFQTRRHTGTFTVRVPKGFDEKQKVTWTLASAGQTISIRLKQDGTGSRTVAAPSGAKILGNVGPTASTASILTLTYSSMDSRWEGCWTPLPA